MTTVTAVRPVPTTAQAKYSDKRKKELRDAVERVYRRYGSDLAAFRRDVQNQRELEKLER